MRRLHGTTFLLWLVLATLSLAQPATAARASRIELKDGTVFDSVTYQVDNTYKVISIKNAEEERTVSFTQIALILDTSGKDVTENCIGDYYRSAERAISRETSPVEDSATGARRKYPFRAGFRGGLNFSHPSGDWYRGTQSGLGFDVDLLVTIGRKLALRGSVSKSGASHNPAVFFAGRTVLQDELKWSVWRYFLSVQYQNWPRWRYGGEVMYYMYSGLGFVGHKLSGTALEIDVATGELWLISGTGETETKFATTFGAGLAIIPGKTVGFDLGVELDYVYAGSASSGAAATGLIFDLKFGIVLLFK